MTVPDLVARHSRTTPDRPALIAGDHTLSYNDLNTQLDRVADALVGLGVDQGHTIGVAMRDGAEMAITFLGASAVAAAAPLNPSFRQPEFDFEIDDLELAAMIVGTGAQEVPAAVAAAEAKGVPLVRISSTSNSGFELKIEGSALGPARTRARSDDNDVALVLHTSGTTARPKIVPLRHRNLLASARAISHTLSLEPRDRVCNVMPLFHIHGLVAGLCSSLVAGATVIATPGFSSSDMPRWLSQHQASWYTAVPTMHQALLERFRSNPQDFAGVDLRLVRSSSASLPPSVMSELEATFGCPVIEAYGMTEAAHQMSCNPLPPAQRKPGSVGLAAGPEVAVMDATGSLLGTDSIGEIVIKGPNVMDGYHDNDEANAAAFADGWFRTGDQGRIDSDGYVFLTGRLKEIINRGGEKVSPREIDETILDHPAVVQVVTFAVPDERLGEQVAAAVVRAQGCEVSERELRQHASEQLAPYKVPRRIVFVDAIPKGPSGKLRRIGLGEQLGLADLDAHQSATERVAPGTSAEMLMAELWGEVLGRSDIGATEHFLDVGGDSLAATRLLTRVRDEIAVEVSMLDFFDAPTIAEQGSLIEALLLAEVPNS